MLSDASVQQQLPVALVGLMTLLSPYITALFTKTSMSPKVKQVIALVVAALIAVVWVVFNGGIDSWEKFFIAVPVIFGIGQALYGLLLKDSVKVVEATQGRIDPPVVIDGPVLGVVAPVGGADVVVSAEDETPAKG